MSNYTKNGFELVVEPYGLNGFSGECKELNYYDSARTVGLLHLRFIKFVNDREDKKVKNQFSVIVDNYTLKVMEFEGNRPWRGVCEEVGFDWGGFIFLEDLVRRFREKIEEKKLQPEEIEYEGYLLHIEKPDKDNAWYVGTSAIQGELWESESATKEEIERAFKLEVDTRLNNRRLTSAIKEIEANINREQRELKKFLEKEGYIITVPVIQGYEYYPLYAVHPQYYDQWRANHEGLPYHAVVFIGENSELFY